MTKYEPGLWGQWMWCAGSAAELLRPTGWDSPETTHFQNTPITGDEGQVGPQRGHRVSYLDEPGQLRYIGQVVINNI